MLPGIKLFDLTDRVAIVTGGSKGLGKAMAAGLASAGARIVLLSRNQSEVDAAAAEIASDHGVSAMGTHGGGVWYRSNPGQGAAFTLMLPEQEETIHV